MNNKFNNDIHVNRDMHTRRSQTWLRSICATCALVFWMVSFVGCCNHSSYEEIDSLRNEISPTIQEVETLKSSNESAQREIDALKVSNESAQREIDALKGSNESAQREIDTLKESNESVQREIDALKESNESAQREIDALKENNEAARQEIEALKKQLEELMEHIPPTEPTDKIRIYIDQGHNPTYFPNSGAMGNGLYEQDLTFEIGHLLAALLEEDGRFEVRLSRPTSDTVLGTDNDSSLEARVKGAKDFGADYFISLHTNSFDNDSANGIEVHVKEQESTSYIFGSSLLKGLIDSTALRNRGMRISPSFYVLKNATMPAVLVEMGFITNATDSALLEQSPELFAQGIYDGILEYFELTVY